MRTIALALVAAASAAALVVSACGSSSDGSGFGTGNDDAGTGPGGGDGSTPPLVHNDAGTLLGDGGNPPPNQNCSDAAKLIYVIDDKGILYSFNPTKTLYEDAGAPPATAVFTPLGKPNCAWGLGGPNSMAVDRNAVAWIGDNAGGLWRVDTAHVTTSCQSTGFKAGQHGWGKFGMGFATDMAGGTTDTLYVNDNESQPGAGDSKGLGKIDLATMTLTTIGPFSGAQAGHDCELTGTGDAKLYGFFFQAQSTVNEIDKATGNILSNASVPVNVNLGGGGNIDWAFSFWGGDFYLYTADTSQAPYSDVTRYRPSDGSSKVVLSQIGFNIVGAGVSTCAPTTIPPVK